MSEPPVVMTVAQLATGGFVSIEHRVVAHARLRAACSNINAALKAGDSDFVSKAISALALLAYDAGLAEGFAIAEQHATADSVIEFGAAREVLAKELRAGMKSGRRAE